MDDDQGSEGMCCCLLTTMSEQKLKETHCKFVIELHFGEKCVQRRLKRGGKAGDLANERSGVEYQCNKR